MSSAKCKDWSQPADLLTFAKFARVLDSTKSRFGILFSREVLRESEVPAPHPESSSSLYRTRFSGHPIDRRQPVRARSRGLALSIGPCLRGCPMTEELNQPLSVVSGNDSPATPLHGGSPTY